MHFNSFDDLRTFEFLVTSLLFTLFSIGDLDMLCFTFVFTFLISPAATELVDPPEKNEEHYELDEAS